MNQMKYKTKEINGVKYTAYILNNKITGLTYTSPNLVGKRTVQKYSNSYTNKVTSRFQNIAQHFLGV